MRARRVRERRATILLSAAKRGGSNASSSLLAGPGTKAKENRMLEQNLLNSEFVPTCPLVAKHSAAVRREMEMKCSSIRHPILSLFPNSLQ